MKILLGLAVLLCSANVYSASTCQNVFAYSKNPVNGVGALENGVYPAFDKITTEQLLPALEAAIESAKKTTDRIRQIKKPTFKNTIVPLELAEFEISKVNEIFGYYGLSFPTEKHQAIESYFEKRVTNYNSEFYTDTLLFKKIKIVYDNREKLEPDQKRLAEKYFASFERRGVNLAGKKLERFKKIQEELSAITVQFRNNVTQYSQNNAFVVSNVAELAGIPENLIKILKENAENKKLSGYLVTLDHGVVSEIMMNSTNANLREKVWRLNTKKAYKSGKTDNSELAFQIAKLRQEQAQLLGYENHTEYVLSGRMAKNWETVTKFNQDLIAAYRKKAFEDEKELRDFVKSKTGTDELNPWDRSYWSKKLLEEKYVFDENKFKEYLVYANVRQAMFELVEKNYGLKFIARSDLPKPGEGVEVFEVQSSKDELYGYILVDMFARENKKEGAWMTQMSSAMEVNGKRRPAIVSINLNLTKPAGNDPVLLTINDGETLYHEFGHALHGLLSKARYQSLSGTNVKWDFVELPSQFMENFFRDPTMLKSFAKHYQTGQEIPDQLMNSFVRSSHFLTGLSGLRQLGLQLIDFAWYTGKVFELYDQFGGDIAQIEKYILEPVTISERNEETVTSTSFNHIFSGGYDSGYYSYKWAEVLDADAFSFFQKEGLTNPETAQRFLKFILEVGDSVDPMEAYIQFAGRPPKVDAMLERAGVTPGDAP